MNNTKPGEFEHLVYVALYCDCEINKPKLLLVGKQADAAIAERDAKIKELETELHALKNKACEHPKSAIYRDEMGILICGKCKKYWDSE